MRKTLVDMVNEHRYLEDIERQRRDELVRATMERRYAEDDIKHRLFDEKKLEFLKVDMGALRRYTNQVQTSIGEEYVE